MKAIEFLATKVLPAALEMDRGYAPDRLSAVEIKTTGGRAEEPIPGTCAEPGCTETVFARGHKMDLCEPHHKERAESAIL